MKIRTKGHPLMQKLTRHDTPGRVYTPTLDYNLVHQESVVSKGLSKRRLAKATAPKVGSHSSHPDHTVHLKRLSRVRGQIDGIERMITNKRYCPDIINQIKAASAALIAIEAAILRTHLRGCVKQVFNNSDELDAERKIDEIVKMMF